MMSILVFAAACVAQHQTVRVSTTEALQLAIRKAEPGTTILIEPGEYRGGISVSNLHGTKDRPIVLAGASPRNPPKFIGGTSGMQLSSVEFLQLQDITFVKAEANGLNIDDGGTIDRPSHHIKLSRIKVAELPKGNHDGIKLSGVDEFEVTNCSLANWGGSGIDMVGCHRGVIRACEFRNGGDNGVQAKGGSSEIVIRKCQFINAGPRGVNLGGSTGSAFFRPSLEKMGKDRYEAKGLVVEGCTFTGSDAAVAFVGVDGAVVRFNTIHNPGRWAMRILQETREAGFVPSRHGSFTDNLIVFKSTNWSAGGVNIGSDTDASSFRFARNFWFCSDAPAQSKPTLPTPEERGTYGVDPLLTVGLDGIVRIGFGSPAANIGAEGFRDASR
ncbi:MAG: right-handed parallel beta-helix repeat-containing protein [Fimbriimonadaceae bacterium]